mgnify:CR=1 FL=1
MTTELTLPPSPLVSRLLKPIEFISAALMTVIVVMLLVGVVSRYVFHHPLIWSDEVASILFLWLAMLGSIVAFQRGEHMRMTAIVGKLEPRRRAFLDLVAIAAALERGSRHPIASAFADIRSPVQATQLQQVAGAGIRGLFVGAVLLALGYQIFMGWVAANPEAKAAADADAPAKPKAPAKRATKAKAA